MVRGRGEPAVPARPDIRTREIELLGTKSGNSGPRSLSARFTNAYRELSPRVLGYLRTQGVEDPEAVSHEVFIALYQTFDRIGGGDADVRTMTFSIAHARVVDHHRARDRKPHMVEFDANSDPRRSPSAEESAADGLGQHGVFALVNTLGAEQREAVLLRIVAGLTLEETSHVMERSVGAVKQLQRRALESLRTSLSQEEDHE